MEWIYRTFLGLETRPAGDLAALEAERETLLVGREAIDQALLINRDRIDALIERVIPVATTPGSAPKTHCNYPYCNCPFDAPADPNWCARGLPHVPKVTL